VVPELVQRGHVDPADKPWLRFYDADVPRSIDVPDEPFALVLEEAADRWPGSVALCHLGREITYRELRHDVEQLSTCLARLGVTPGDRVGIVLPNCAQLVISLFAALRLGAVAVPLSPALTAEQTTSALADCGAEVVLCSDRFYEKVAAARKAPGTAIREVVVTLITDYLPALDRIALTGPARSPRRERARACSSVPPGAGVRMWGEELRRARGLPVPASGKASGVSPSADPAVLLYPAADPPRGLVLTSCNLRAAGAQAAAWLTHVRPGRECVLVGLPLSSAEGLALCLSAATQLGAALQLVPSTAAEGGPSALDGLRPTVVVGPEAFLEEILGAEDQETGLDLRSLRLCVTGPVLLSPERVRHFEEVSGAAVVDGLSVPGAPLLLSRPVRAGRAALVGGGGAGNSSGAFGAGASRIGIPLPSTEVRFVDEAGTALPAGRPGRLEVRGPQTSAAIWGHPEESERRLRDGWLRTGLAGCLHADGWVEVLPPT
jgi:long-chain acyl-CoA synthetase